MGQEFHSEHPVFKKKKNPTTLKDNSTFYLTFFFLKWREVTDARCMDKGKLIIYQNNILIIPKPFPTPSSSATILNL